MANHTRVNIMFITWNIRTLERRVADGFVTTAHWYATAVDGEHTASIYSTCSWVESTPKIPYSDLTEATVCGWIWENGVNKTEIESALMAKINEKKNPKFLTETPWSI
jgi:hypothetical protein